ncbi:MAG: hypothetical protein K0S61_797 [Anaerocolumna sp.]|jgi:hypothetical protein|nr:hypothetical protein [Anaerocolumna sp.]
MTKLERLLKKCMEQNTPKGGTAESFNNALTDLGRWVFTLYCQGKIILTKDPAEAFYIEERETISDYVKQLGELCLTNVYWKEKKRNLGELIAACHYDLSKVLEESQTGYHPSYTYYRNDSEPKGIPAELANVIIRIFVICYYYEIDIETVFVEKVEIKKCRKHAQNNKIKSVSIKEEPLEIEPSLENEKGND